MAKITLNPMIQHISGRMGNVIYRISPTGEQQITKVPDMSNVKWSKAQKEHRRRFKQAVAYAKAAMADPQFRPIYEQMAAEKKKRPFDVAVSDYFKGNNLLSKK